MRPARDAEGVLELEAEALLLVERRRDLRLEGGKAASPEAGRIALLARAQSLPRGERKDLRLDPQGLPGLLAHERDDLRPVLRRLQEVGLVEDEHDLLAPLPDRLEKGPLALGVGTVGRGDEEHEVGPRKEVPGERLVLAQDRVRARRVHDRQRPQGVGGSGRLLDAVGARRPGHFAPVPEDPHPRGGRRHPLFEDAGAEERVDERALARVELPHHHEQEGEGELLARVGEGLARGLVDAEALEGRGGLGDEAAGFLEEGLAGGVEGGRGQRTLRGGRRSPRRRSGR